MFGTYCCRDDMCTQEGLLHKSLMRIHLFIHNLKFADVGFNSILTLLTVSLVYLLMLPTTCTVALNGRS